MISDQKGLPIWENVKTFKNRFQQGKNSGTSTSIIPLSDNGKNLSSLLFVESKPGENSNIYTITNDELFDIVNNKKIPAKNRETILMQFLYFDYLTFGERKYGNIPMDLFSTIKAKSNKNYKQFTIKVSNIETPISITSRQVSDVCFILYHCSAGIAECSEIGCSTISCYGFGGLGNPSSYGDSYGGSDSGSTGGGTSGDSSNNAPWYLMNPDIDIYTYNSKIRNIFKNLTDYDIILQREQLDYLKSNTAVLDDLTALLVNNTREKSEFTNNVIGALNDGVLPTYKDFKMAVENFKYSLKSPCDVDLSKVTPDATLPNNDLKIKFMCVYNKLIESTLFKNLFVGTFGDGKRPNVSFEIADVPNKANGNTSPIANNLLDNKIIIDIDLLRGGNNMSIAKTILHECIHAYLNVKLRDPSLGISIPQLNDMDVEACINQYYNNFSQGQNQHNFIYSYMLPTMKTVLSQVKDLLVSPTNNETMEGLTMHIPFDNSPGTSWNWNDFYENLALSGLQDCNFFKSEIGTFNSNGTILSIVDQGKMQKYNQYNNRGHENLEKTCN